LVLQCHELFSLVLYSGRLVQSLFPVGVLQKFHITSHYRLEIWHRCYFKEVIFGIFQPSRVALTATRWRRQVRRKLFINPEDLKFSSIIILVFYYTTFKTIFTICLRSLKLLSFQKYTVWILCFKYLYFIILW